MAPECCFFFHFTTRILVRQAKINVNQYIHSNMQLLQKIWQFIQPKINSYCHARDQIEINWFEYECLSHKITWTRFNQLFYYLYVNKSIPMRSIPIYLKLDSDQLIKPIKQRTMQKWGKNDQKTLVFQRRWRWSKHRY